jgi:hypothetical protein
MKLIVVQMVERGVLTIKWLHYNKLCIQRGWYIPYQAETCPCYGGLLQVSNRPKHAAWLIEQSAGVLRYK